MCRWPATPPWPAPGGPRPERREACHEEDLMIERADGV
jgi:hypothetical protein